MSVLVDLVRNLLRDLPLVVSVVALIAGAALRGWISPLFATLAMAALVAIVFIGRGRGHHLGHVVRRTYRIVLPVASLLFLAMSLGNRDEAGTLAIFLALGALVLVLFGVGVMFFGLFGKR